MTLGDPNENEVVVRFAESLPDDDYRIELFGFDDAGLGIRGLQNSSGEFFVPSDPTQRFDLLTLAVQSDGFSGAEIEQVVLSGLYEAFTSGGALDTQSLLSEVGATRPLSVTMGERVEAMRAWARGRTVPAN